ncbi:hypothetical protein [Microbacterium paraoxydans]|uniref:hypothetical protein n=1 Tax=Microbacterium paraoxydans TaxID=199592 RepID=UPI001CFA38AE|nr:hypothetical protein [Microbacterium paraoxydans]
MYEHPYLSEQLTKHDQEQIERAAARRLFLLEHADQIRPRPEGAIRRMLRRAFGGSRRHAAGAAPVPCDAAAAHAR